MKVKQPTYIRTTWNLLVLAAMLVMALGIPTPVLAAAPVNDEINFAVPFTVVPDSKTMNEVTFNDSTIAVDDPVASCVGYPYLHSVWYSYTPTSYGNATITTLGSNFDAVVAVWTGSRGNLTEIGCDDDTAGASQAQVKVAMKPGIKYYIEVVQFTTTPTAPQTDLPSDTFGDTDYMTLNLSYSQITNVAPPGKYDDKSTYFTYTGTWYNTSASLAYSGSHKVSRGVLTNKSSITFDGYKFKLYYTRSTANGVLEIRLDGNTTPLHNLNQSGMTAYQQVYESPDLGDGIHTVEFRDAYKYVSIDAIEIIAPPDAVPPSQITNLTATAAAAPNYGVINLAWTAPGDDGAVGTATSYDVRYSAAPITTEAAFNAATKVTTGVPAPKEAGSPETMSVTLSPSLTYYFAVRALDAPAPDSTPGPLSNSPGASAPFVGVVGAGNYEENHSNWMFAGTWVSNLGSLATGGKYLSSATIGNSASFVFNGTGFSITYVMNSSGGVADIRVDGVSVAQINMKSFGTKWLQKYTRGSLSSGQHVVQIVHLSGTKIYLDRITITP